MADYHRAVTLLAEKLGVGVRTLRSAHIGGGDGKIPELGGFGNRFYEHAAAVDMVHGDVEEPLDLVCVEVAGHDTVGTGGTEQIRNQLGSDAHAGAVLAVLTGPAEVRNHRNDLVCRCALGGVDAEQKLHEVIGRRERALDKEHRSSADAVLEGRLELPVAELIDFEIPQNDLFAVGSSGFLKILYNLLCEGLGSPAAKNQHSVFVLHRLRL